VKERYDLVSNSFVEVLRKGESLGYKRESDGCSKGGDTVAERNKKSGKGAVLLGTAELNRERRQKGVALGPQP